MSGIVALLDRTGSAVDTERVKAMQDCLSHRGPDGGGRWCDGRIGLGHQQLQTTPEGAYDEQPTRNGSVVVTADIRLDNRKQLLQQLSVSRPPTQLPDSELLLTAYEQWGTDCVEQLVGAFAFVIWDSDRERLFCARDRFGVKPLYYHSKDGIFAVASEKKGLLTIPSVPGMVDDIKIGDFLTAMYEDTSRTFFEGISRLPPAHAMTVDPECVNTWQYWDLDPTRTLTLGSNAAYEQRFRTLFEQAVKNRLRSDSVVGTALSGGMDSSSITVMARELLPPSETLHTFSNVYDKAPSSDEREFIESLTGHDRIDSHYVFPEHTGPLADEAELRTYFDQPPHNTMHFAVWGRTKCAAENNVDVVLDGALGDSAIGYGLGLLPQLFWTGRWLKLYSELQAMSEIVDAPIKHLFIRHVLSEVIPEPILRWRQQANGALDPLSDENPTLDPSFISRIGLEGRYESFQLEGAMVTPRARQLQYRSLRTGRNVTNFEALDLAHATLGVEPRYPFTDHRLVEFTLAIPPTQQFKNGWTRSLIRRALSDLLPEKIQWRPWKTGVNEAFWNALETETDRLEALADNPGPLEEYLNTKELSAALSRFETEPNSRDARALWRALSMSVWFDGLRQSNQCTVVSE